MVVHERAEGIDIFESSIFLFVAVADSVHRLASSENILDSEVHWVVEQPSHVILIIRHVADVTIEAFTHLEHSCSFAILRPEWFLDVGDRVDTDAIEIVLRDNGADPCLEVGSHVVIGLVKIWEPTEPTVFDRPLVAEIDVTFGKVIVLRLVKRVDS